MKKQVAQWELLSAPSMTTAASLTSLSPALDNFSILNMASISYLYHPLWGQMGVKLNAFILSNSDKMSELTHKTIKSSQ